MNNNNNNEMYSNILDELKNWNQIIKKYQIPNNKKAASMFISTFLMFLSIWTIQYLLLIFNVKYALVYAILISIFNGFVLGRLFIVQHDCGHKSFTSSEKWNNIIGSICSVCTIIPYKYWAKSHDYHHAHNAQIETSDIGDVQCLTTEQYNELSFWGKVRYRVYRNPFYLFTIGGFLYITVFNRFEFLKSDYFNKVKNNAYISNLVFGSIYIALGFLLKKEFFIVQFINIFFFGTYALWFFYVQHQYENVYKASKNNWNYLLSAIRGCTYYNLPKIGHWLSGNIGFHHIHHLAPSIPNYNLAKCSKENPILQKYAVEIKLFSSFKSVTSNLWDEKSQKMISFGEYKKNKKKNS